MIEAVALALGAALAVACVLLAARPFLRTDAEPAREASPADDERIRLEEKRDRALEALKELEFDHRTGKVADADYRAFVAPLRREAAEALRALDRKEAPMGAIAMEEPARVPEPWPPPDEGDVPDPAPTPAPGDPTPGPEEPAPPEHPPMPQTGGSPLR
jgi:hypothetical protein